MRNPRNCITRLPCAVRAVLAVAMLQAPAEPAPADLETVTVYARRAGARNVYCCGRN